MKKIIFLLIMMAQISGCTSIQQIRVGKEPLNVIDRGSSVYVITPEDGSYGDNTYPDSGTAVAGFIYSAFLEYLERVEISDAVESLETGMAKAKNKGFSYLVYPEITEWQGRVEWSEWPENQNKVELKISVYETSSGSLFDAVVIKADSSIFNVSEKAENMLEKPIDKYVSSLFNKPL